MIVYKATNLVTGKIYIGQTVASLNKRISIHLCCKTGYFPKSLRKYGLQCFDFSIVETCESRDVLNERERYWINYFNCKSPNGYNLTDGGENPPSQLGRKRTEETKALLRGNHNALGTKHSAGTRAKVAKAKIGNKNSLGSKRTAESRKKTSLAMKGRKLSLEHKKKLSEAAKIRMKKYPMPWERDRKDIISAQELRQGC